MRKADPLRHFWLTLLRDDHVSSPRRVADVFRLVAADMDRAQRGQPILMREWTERLRRDGTERSATVRALFTLCAIAGVSVSDLSTWDREFRQASPRLRRPGRRVRQPAERVTGELW